MVEFEKLLFLPLAPNFDPDDCCPEDSMMEYPGFAARDLDDVTALNAAFVELIAQDQDLLKPLIDACPATARQMAELTPLQRSRLARAPFLLMSFRESDKALWQQLRNGEPEDDLFDCRVAPAPATERLLDAGLGFVWQLSRSNVYTARMVCAADIDWCDSIAKMSLVDLLAKAHRHGALLIPRAATEVEFWDKLLVSATGIGPATRRAARLCALQMLFTRASAAVPVQAAACRMTGRARRMQSRPPRH